MEYYDVRHPNIEEGMYIYDVPIWYVTNISGNKVGLQITFFLPKVKYGDYKIMKAEDLTEFVVKLGPGAPNDGALGDPSEGRVGKIIKDTMDSEDEVFIVRDNLSGDTSEYSKYNLEFVDVSAVKEQARQAKAFQLVSRQGALPKIPSALEQVVLSKLTGLPESYSSQKMINTLKESIEGPKHIYNVALKKGPLPYGPKESNFMGGRRSGTKQRKSLRKIGKQMARRGTRRSGRGIFSRLYSPIGHLLSAGKESVGAVTNTAKGVVGEGIHGLDKIGRSVSKHANMAVKDVFTRKGGKRKARGTRKSRKSRRNTRRRR